MTPFQGVTLWCVLSFPIGMLAGRFLSGLHGNVGKWLDTLDEKH